MWTKTEVLTMLDRQRQKKRSRPARSSLSKAPRCISLRKLSQKVKKYLRIHRPVLTTRLHLVDLHTTRPTRSTSQLQVTTDPRIPQAALVDSPCPLSSMGCYMTPLDMLSQLGRNPCLVESPDSLEMEASRLAQASATFEYDSEVARLLLLSGLDATSTTGKTSLVETTCGEATDGCCRSLLPNNVLRRLDAPCDKNDQISVSDHQPTDRLHLPVCPSPRPQADLEKDTAVVLQARAIGQVRFPKRIQKRFMQLMQEMTSLEAQIAQWAEGYNADEGEEGCREVNVATDRQCEDATAELSSYRSIDCSTHPLAAKKTKIHDNEVVESYAEQQKLRLRDIDCDIARWAVDNDRELVNKNVHRQCDRTNDQSFHDNGVKTHEERNEGMFDPILMLQVNQLKLQQRRYMSRQLLREHELMNEFDNVSDDESEESMYQRCEVEEDDDMCTHCAGVSHDEECEQSRVDDESDHDSDFQFLDGPNYEWVGQYDDSVETAIDNTSKALSSSSDMGSTPGHEDSSAESSEASTHQSDDARESDNTPDYNIPNTISFYDSASEQNNNKDNNEDDVDVFHECLTWTDCLRAKTAIGCRRKKAVTSENSGRPWACCVAHWSEWKGAWGRRYGGV